MLVISDTTGGKLYRIKGWSDIIRQGDVYLLPVDAKGAEEILIVTAEHDLPQEEGGSFLLETV
jgi:hypothetical protein